MSENKKVNIESMQINLDDNKSIELLSNRLSDLKEKGYKQVIIEIKMSIEQQLTKFSLDIATFERIKEMQELPDWVVINLLLAGGKLKGTDFKVRSINE